MPPRSKKIGSIWEVPYTFEEDQTKFKKRPIIVISSDKKNNRVIGLKCTTKDKPKEKYAYVLLDGSMMHELNMVLCNHVISVKDVNRNFRYIGQLADPRDILNIYDLYNDAKNSNDLIISTREWVEVDDGEYFTESIEDLDTEASLKDIVNEVRSLTKDIFKDHMSLSGINPVIGAVDNSHLVQYSSNLNSFTDRNDGFGVIDSKKDTKMRVKEDNNKTQFVDKEPFLQDKFYSIYRHKKDRVTWVEASNLYEEITGKVMLSKDQVLYDDDFEEYDYNRTFKAALNNGVVSLESEVYKNFSIPVIGILELNMAKIKLKEFRDNTFILKDNKGYFALDMHTGLRTRSYGTITEIESAPFKMTLDMSDKTKDSRIDDANSSGMYKVLDAEYESEERLMSDWDEYNNLTPDEKKASDDISIEIFGRNNTERFKELRAKYLNAEIKMKDLSITESVSFDQIKLSDVDLARDLGIELRNKKYEAEYIWNWSLNSGIYVVLPCDTEEELDIMWNNVQSMDISLIRISDSKLMEVFGCNNETMYNFLKGLFTSRGFDDYHYFPLVENASLESTEFELPNILPLYIPYEIEVFKKNNTFAELTGEDKLKANAFLKEYKVLYETGKFNKRFLSDWIDVIREKSYRLSRDPENNTLKQILIEFGWSPYMEFNASNMDKATNRCKELAKRSMIRRTLQEKGIGYEFNDKGDLRLKNIFKSDDYQTQYMESHRLLMEYDKAKNIKGMKYELARMYSISSKIDQELMTNKRDSHHKELINIRARVLNDFKKYIKVVLKYDKQFNFSAYYQSSEFSDDSFVITAPTLKYSGKYVNRILKVI